MQKYFSKNSQRGRDNIKNMPTKQVSRSWGNATRLEHSNVRNKNKSKKG